MNKKEILKLHTLSEKEQLDRLCAWRVLKPLYHLQPYSEPVRDAYYTFRHDCLETSIWESLADCAFRMRDEWMQSIKWNNLEPHPKESYFLGCMIIVYKRIQEIELEFIDEFKKYTKDWFGLYAQPIHWIQAALLAKLAEAHNCQNNIQ